MSQKHDIKVTYEKGKLHIRYLLIIAVILAVIGISIALGGNSDALGQISMASTVSSIILSSIAIFMSISGENKLNHAQNTLLETSDRLSNITANIEQANSLLDGSIGQKLSKLDEISDRLERIGQSVDNVEKEMFSKTFNIQEDSTVNISNDVLWKLYDDLTNNYSIGQETEKLMEYVVTVHSKNRTFDFDNFSEYLESVLDGNAFSIALTYGILGVFIAVGITNEETTKYFEKRMVISEEKRKEIEKFL